MAKRATAASRTARREQIDRDAACVAKWEFAKRAMNMLADDPFAVSLDGSSPLFANDPPSRAPIKDDASEVSLYYDLAGPYTKTVYVIHAVNGPAVKIGVSSDPLSRLATLQTGYDRRLIYYWGARMLIRDAFRVEREVHTSLGLTINHQIGEWYWLDRAAARDAIKKAINKLGVRWVPSWPMVADDGAFDGVNGEVRFPLAAFKRVLSAANMEP